MIRLKPSLLVLALACLPALAATTARTAPSPTRASLDEKDDEFRRRFAEAMKINATKEMERLVRSMTDQAVLWIIDTAKAISVQTGPELEERMAALRGAWKESMETDFCDNVYEYFSLLDPTIKAERDKAQQRYEKTRLRFLGNLEKKDPSVFGQVSIEFKGVAGVFEQLGDKYHASQAWIYYGNSNRDDVRGSDADPYAVCEAYKHAYQLREDIGLKDTWWINCKAKYESLAREGFDRERPPAGGESEPGGGPPAGGGPKAAGPAITAPTAFERVEDLMAYERPMYNADELYQLWNKLYLAEKGATGKIVSLGDLSPTAHRVGSNEVLLDVDGDGVGEQRVPITGNWEPVQFQIGQGAEARPWACLTTIGTNQEIFQTVQVNLAPTDQNLTIYVVPAASVEAEIDGESVRIFDDNGDGIYGSPPKEWSYTGMAPEMLHPDLDSVSIGGDKRCVPWSKYLEIGGQWYSVASAAGGTRLEASPLELPTGSVRLKYKGPDAAWVILRGSGRLDGAYFDIADGKVDLPAGNYQLFYGDVRKGKKRQVTKAVMLPGPSTPIWTVIAGETLTIELGAPFGFDFDYQVSGRQLSVDGKSVIVTGAAGERYTRFWECVPDPEVSWREAGSRRGSKGEDMGHAMNMMDPDFWTQSWHPLDLTVDMKGDPEEVEVQLVEKKNKLFGKIESEWKGR